MEEVSYDIDDTFYGKFVQNQRAIRNLAIADPKSYAAVVVRAADRFITATAMMKEHSGDVLKSCCTKRILKEFAASLRASEIFAIWLPELRRNLQSMAGDVIKSEGRRSSAVDRYARICYGMLMIRKDEPDSITKAIKFMDDARKKYPTEIFFWRTYCYLFTFTKDWTAGLSASDEACKLFPNNANILNARAVMLRMIADPGDVDYVHWSKQKKQAEEAKQAFKDYLKIAPKDHRHFADNNYFIAYFAFKYAAPSTEMMLDDIREISRYFQSGLNAEKDIVPCFLPYTSEAKNIIAAHVNYHSTLNVHVEDSCFSVMPGPPTTGFIHIDGMSYMSIRMPTERRIDACVAHRHRLRKMLSDPVIVASLTQLSPDGNTNSMSTSNHTHCDDYEELILHQMTMTKTSHKFISKMIQLTVVEDSVYSSGHFETIVADTTGDVIKLQVNLSTERPENHRLKGLMRKFRFGTVWKLLNPDLYMENGDESTMFVRTTPECLIPVSVGPKCRMCFQPLDPGQRCARCKMAVYCGKDCQRLDWERLKHNLICCEGYANFYK